MATRKVLQEIPIFPPETEQQSFVIITEEAIPDSCSQILSFPTRAHAKYISNDESKENITPAEFDGVTTKYKYEKSDVGKTVDIVPADDLGDLECRPALGSNISLQQKDTEMLEKTTRAESTITPRKDTDYSDWRIGESNTPVDFSKVTVDDFGISSECFTNCIGKSPRSLQKHRRRSTIGVRGSPEMNFLIRQIALQRSNRKNNNTEPPTSLFISPRNSILKEKMSSFRDAFQAIEEREGKLPLPGLSEEETQRDTLGRKVFGNVSEMSQPPEKRKRVCNDSLPEPHALLLSTQPKETAPEIEVPMLEKISESDDSSASRLFTAISDSVDVQNEDIQPVLSTTRGQKRKVMFTDLLSPPESNKPLHHNKAQDSDCHTSSNPVLRPALKKTAKKELSGSGDELEDQRVCFLLPEPMENENNTLFKKPVNDSVKKKKRVTFGRELSPELFDKSLPANTPLRKGSTPYRQHDTAMPTAQDSVHHSPCQPLSQPDFDSNEEDDTFKPLSLCFDAGSPSQDSSMLLTPPGYDDQVLQVRELKDVAQDDLCREENEMLPICLEFQEHTTAAFSELDKDVANESFIVSERDTVSTKNRMTRSSNKSKADCCETPATSDNSQIANTSKVQGTTTSRPSFKRNRKPVLIKKLQVKVSNGKKSRGRPRKSVQKPLYGERETASKKPLLSPIPELPECCPTPPVYLGGTLNKGIGKKTVRKRGIRRDSGKVQKNNVTSQVANSSSDSIILKIEDVDEDTGCPGQEGLEVKHVETFIDSQRHTEVDDSAMPVDILNTNAEYTLSSAAKEMEHNECLLQPGDSDTVTDNKGTIETVTTLKPHYKSKRRSTAEKRGYQTITDMTDLVNTETITDPIENLINTDHSIIVTSTEDQKPEKEELVQNKTHSLKLPLIAGIASGKKGRRSSRNYGKSALSCLSTEPNIHSQDPYTMLPHADENSITNEPCLAIDEIFQAAGTEKKVRRSMRLRRDSGVSGLFWVQERTSNEGSSRRKSLSSSVQPLGTSNLNLESVTFSPNKEQLSVKQVPSGVKRKSLSSAVQCIEISKLILESVTHSPSKEQLSVQQLPSAAKKSRRRTLCTSTLQQATSLSDTKRRSTVSYKDSNVPSADNYTCHNIALDT